MSGEELLGLMTDSGFPHPGPPAGDGEQERVFPSIQTSTEQAVASYAQNSGQDSLAQLLELLQAGDDSATYSSLQITT